MFSYYKFMLIRVYISYKSTLLLKLVQKISADRVRLKNRQ